MGFDDMMRTLDHAGAGARRPVSDSRTLQEVTMSDRVEISNNTDKERYEARIGGELAGAAEYQLTNQLIVFTHTEVNPRFEGRGIGGSLARHALDELAADGTRKVLPICPFIKAWIGKHPDYLHLVYAAPGSTAEE
jgi:uncharacterized protein